MTSVAPGAAPRTRLVAMTFLGPSWRIVPLRRRRTTAEVAIDTGPPRPLRRALILRSFLRSGARHAESGREDGLSLAQPPHRGGRGADRDLRRAQCARRCVPGVPARL